MKFLMFTESQCLMSSSLMVSRLDSEEDQESDKWPLLHSEADSPAPVEGHNNTKNNNNNDDESTKTDEPNTSQRCQTECKNHTEETEPASALDIFWFIFRLLFIDPLILPFFLSSVSDGKVWNVSEGAELFVSKVKPKEGCQTDEEEADNGEDERRPKGAGSKEPERDVYSFPGDSDPESPPPAPWAHCTFIQRCRKKRVLLRPFSGLGTLRRTSPASGGRARASPQKLKPADSAQQDGAGGVYDFEDFETVEKPIKFRDREEEEEEESGGVQSTEIFTCVECSIYFKKQKHLQEHMVEHCQSEEGGGRGEGQNGRFQCVECGWSLLNHLELADHHRRHQESRLKILEEIEKLNENGPLRCDARCRSGLDSRRNALANHTKTHNRKKAVPKTAPLSPASSSCTLSCGLCSFQALTQTLMREHHKLVHQEHIRAPQAGETGRRSRSKVGARVLKHSLDSDRLSEVSDSEDCTITDITEPPNRRFSRRGETWTSLVKFHPRGSDEEDDDEFPGSEREEEEEEEEQQDGDQSKEIDAEEENSPVEEKPHNRARSNTGETHQVTLTVFVHSSKDAENGQGKFISVAHFNNMAIQSASHKTSKYDIDEDNVRRFLSEAVLDEDNEETDEDAEAMKSVERKCPYCPDRFHNGIGLANHVRGHLNRVGVSYNVRHFISPEEVNAIEKKFSYQKKKKKVANFDPDTFSVMHCEFCSAGFDTRAGLSSHARAHLRDFGITNWDVTISPIHILRELFSNSSPLSPPGGGMNFQTPSAPLRKIHNLKCEVCGARFETKRGLSIHARYHLRRLGIGVAEHSGAALTLLHQIAKERNISPLLKLLPLSFLAKAAKSVPPSSSSTPTPPPGASPAPPHSGSPPSVVRKAPISSLLPVSSPLRSPEHKAGGMKSLTSSLSSSITATKPLWAPQEDDAPLNLTLEVDPTKDIVCQLCGAWFETRKGLSSHARAHLRHFGVEYSESKGSPIDLLHQLMDSDDFKHKHSSLLNLSSSSSSSSLLYKVTTARGGSTSKATSSSASSLHGPPAKRLKSSSMRVFRLSSGELMALPHSEPPKEIGCEFCGEYFENRKGLSSHARSHLRQMGITEWSVNGSPIDTLRDIITRRGLPCALPLKPHLKTPPPSSPGGPPPRSPLSASPSSASLLGRLPFAFARPSSPPPSVSKSSSPTRDIRCEFCGEYFENRKGLSSHARSHLRQMGITEWSVNGSPIDTLREVIPPGEEGGEPWGEQSSVGERGE
uniref:Protein Wiz-like n=1 Tax=Labrus bergylta TaxID=56723 RepID=A0A3Q3GRG2_9LABR